MIYCPYTQLTCRAISFSNIPISLTNDVFDKLKTKFRLFKFNLKNKNENRVKKQIFIDQNTMSRLEQIIQSNNLATVQNGLNFLMDGLSLKMRETKELNRQNTIKMQFQNKQLDLLKQQSDQYKKRNKKLVILHNKNLENLSSSLSDFVTEDFQQRLNQSLENILDQQTYTKVIESSILKSLLNKLSEEIKTKIEEATSMIEVQDLN
ncbi:hypothetical protein ACG9YX_02990 [Acinetobacter nematophilus]|uniref:hypothetical protein n=1 Tax=Acinetobacter nematophilus TaxID=2994642 RepID=UPI003AF6245B